MRTIILYASRHHGNTKKLVDAIVEAHPEIDTLDVKALGKNEYPNLHEYHLIGVATGIYYSEIDKDMARVLTNVLQPQDKVFGLMTYGGKNKWYGKDIDGICRMRQAIFMGVYGCPGFDTWGPFKLAGGVQKGHPTAEEIKGAVDFLRQDRRRIWRYHRRRVRQAREASSIREGASCRRPGGRRQAHGKENR